MAYESKSATKAVYIKADAMATGMAIHLNHRLNFACPIFTGRRSTRMPAPTSVNPSITRATNNKVPT